MIQPQTLSSSTPANGLPGPTKMASNADLWSAAGSVIAWQTRMPALTHLPTTAAATLSLAQERLWLLEQSEPGAPYYHIPISWEISGMLDFEALEKSINFLAQRHAALRTSFPSTDKGPIQQINELNVELTVEDLSSMPSAEAKAESWKRAARFVEAPMSIEKGPLFRAVVSRRSATEHWLVAVFHQMVFDGASMRVFNRELGQCYGAFSAGRTPAFEPLPISYTDFSRWQLDCVQQTPDASTFWQARLQKQYQPLRLPSDRPRHLTSGITPGQQVPINFPKALMDALKELAHAEGITPFAAFLGSFQSYLARLTNQDDVLTFASMAARTHPTLRNIIGLVANVLPLRLDLSSDPSFRQILARAGEVVSSALANQTLPLSQILEFLSVGDTEIPALQTLIIYNNAPLQPLKCGAATFQPSLALDNGTAKFDFTLDVADSPQGISGFLKYRSDLYREETVTRMLAGWESFLRQAVAQPDLPLGKIEVAAIASEMKRTPEEAIPLSTRPSASGINARGGARVIAYAPPKTETEKQLTVIWENIFGVRPIGVNDNFFGLGGHSLTAVKMLGAIEKETSKKLRLCMVFQQPTIQRLAAAMENPQPKIDHSIVEIQPHGDKPPIFLVHGVGGGMFWGYNNLARELGSDQPVFGFKSRGMDGLEEFTKIEEIASHYVADLLKFKPTGPYRLGGYCFGGNVAYEMARQLRQQGHEVATLMLINCWANNSSYTQVNWSPRLAFHAVTNFFVRFEHQLRRGIQSPVDFIKWRAAWVARRVKSLLVSDSDDRLSVDDIVNLSSQSQEEKNLWRTHVRAWLQYCPQRYDGSVVLFRTRGHPLVCSFDHEMGWGELASGGVTVRVCPGDHESILENENVGYVARELSAILQDTALISSVQPTRASVSNRTPALETATSLSLVPSGPSTI